MQPMGIRVGDCHGRVVGQLPFHTECGLYDVRRAQRRANLLDRLLRLKCGYYRNRWNGGEEIRIRNHVLLLHYPVIARGGERVGEGEAIVKNAGTGAQNFLRFRRFGGRSRRPGQRQARREVSPIMNVALRFVSQPEIQGKPGVDPPVIACEQADIKLASGDLWIAGAEGELGSASTQSSDLGRRATELLEYQSTAISFDRSNRRKGRIIRQVAAGWINHRRRQRVTAAKRECAAEILRRDVCDLVLSHSSAEPQEMLAVSNRSVVLQFKTVLRG